MRRAAGDTRRAAQPEFSLQKTHHTHTLTPIHALDAADVPRLDGTVLSGGAVLAGVFRHAPKLIVVLALGAVRAGVFRRAPKLIVVLALGAVRADAGAFDPVRPGGAARGGGDRATPFDTIEHIGLSGRTVDPSWTTEGGLIV